MLGAISTARNTEVFLYNPPSQLIFLHCAKTVFGKAFGPTPRALKRMAMDNGSWYPGPAGNKGHGKCGQLQKTARAGPRSHL